MTFFSRRFLVLALFCAGAAHAAEPPPPGAETPDARGGLRTGALGSGAVFTLASPNTRWNGKLLIVAHGFVPEGRPLLAVLDREDPVYRRLLDAGWMIAATSYRRNGLILTDAVADVEAMRAWVASGFAPPKTVVVEGTSMGGFVGAMIAENPPDPSYKGILALGAALEIKEPGEHPATLSARPKLPLLLLSTQDEIAGPTAYAQRADAGGGVVAPAVWKVARDGHVNLSRREVGAAYDALLNWIDHGKPPEPRRDVTRTPEPREATVRFAADGVSAQGKVTKIDPAYGNLTVDFRAEDFARLGLRKGDSAAIRIGEDAAAPELRVLLGTTFGDVPQGEWVCFPTADGDTLICRNFADAAASAAAKIGTAVTVRKAGGKL